MTVRRIAYPIAGVVALLVIWEIAVRVSGVAPYVLPAPTRVWDAAGRTAPVLGPHIVTTLIEAGLGLLLGAVAGVGLAVVIVASPTLRLLLYPLITVSQTVPMVVLAPLLIIWTGLGLTPKVIVVMLTVFFPVLIAAVAGAAAASGDLVDMIRGLGGRSVHALWLVRIPSALPAALGGLRIATTYTVGAAVVSEYMAGESGLGVFIQRSRKAFAIDQIFVAVAVIVGITVLLFLLVDHLCALATPWQRTSPKETRSL